MRSPVSVRHPRRVLCVFPAYTPSFGTFSHAYRLMGRVRAFMPPQGLLVIAAYLPEGWQVRFIDENIRPAGPEDFAWADVVFVSGMHIQRPQIQDLHRRAEAAGKVTVLGGPSVSGEPELYPEFHYLHLGEISSATDELIARLDESVEPPPSQVRLWSEERLPLEDFPAPAYQLAALDRYFIGSLQFSSGCPYRCDFCDIPVLYGRQPRLKSPAQVLAELDTMMAGSHPATVYFVDDNFIGNRRATAELLPHLIAWQRRNAYPVQFACEATLNIAKQPQILAMMREARFHTIFVGIETPEVEALKGIRKDHNASLPLLDAVSTLNGYGFEVVAGIILGLDTDTEATADHLLEFVDASRIPMLTINLLQALPRTPLWERLSREGRLVDDAGRESNVRFLRPYDDVVASWRRCFSHVYSPEPLFERFRHQVDVTYANRLKVPVGGQVTAANLRQGLIIILNLVVRVGILSDYRWPFWRTVGHALRRGQVDTAIGMGLVAHHLIQYAREAARGEQNASFYARHSRAQHSQKKWRRRWEQISGWLKEPRRTAPVRTAVSNQRPPL